MADIKNIARDIMMAHSYLESAHKSFNAMYAENNEAFDGESRKAWQAVVTALDAINPIFDWAIDNS